MGLRLVLSGVGEGSVFGNDRLFGVHKPWASPLSKASDPYINYSKLAALSSHPDEAVRKAVASNLAKRMAHYFNPKLISEFEHSIIVEALETATSIHHLFYNSICNFITTSATPNELIRLAKSKTPRVVEMVAETPKTPKPVLMDIAMHYRGHSGSIGSTANQNAYATLAGLNSSFTGSRNILTPDDLIQLAGSVDTRVRTFVLINPQTPFPTIISLLTDGLCVSTETRNNPAHEWALSVFDRIKHELSPMQIARLAKGRNAQLLTGKILELPKTPRSIVLEQAKDGYRDDICTAACERLGLDLTIDEIIFLSHSVRPGAAHAVAAFKQKQETLTTAELDVVAEKAGFPILEEVAKHPQTSQKTLLQLAKHGYVAAYLRIKDQIPTREALTPFMSVPNLLLEVAKHPQLEAAEVAGLLVSNIHTKTVIDEPEEGEYEYDHSDPFNTDYQGRPLPSSYRVTKPAVTHEEYPEEELAKAREILQAQEAKRAGIIAVLRREKPLLAEKLA